MCYLNEFVYAITITYNLHMSFLSSSTNSNMPIKPAQDITDFYDVQSRRLDHLCLPDQQTNAYIEIILIASFEYEKTNQMMCIYPGFKSAVLSSLPISSAVKEAALAKIHDIFSSEFLIPYRRCAFSWSTVELPATMKTVKSDGFTCIDTSVSTHRLSESINWDCLTFTDVSHQPFTSTPLTSPQRIESDGFTLADSQVSMNSDSPAFMDVSQDLAHGPNIGSNKSSAVPGTSMVSDSLSLSLSSESFRLLAAGITARHGQKAHNAVLKMPS
ncbi:hypothetical protein JVT61DRAFT_4277 [Boletus reticuloceps]|uniref:Uncharacterized protein n=1 Tax=Boletus reticuloceps TaxID=495285 RepID=A0A8I2YLC0_9AGAM|nr:hypothetical protein JVT61DRAFT_4277 [Boletus reticuloceps]